jgi:WD40 repeat protein
VAIGAAMGVQAQSGDGIPDNCETGNDSQRAIFPRYVIPENRLILVDWTTGETVQELSSDFRASRFDVRGWSPNCRYLTVATNNYLFRDAELFLTWDVETGQRVGGDFDVVLWSPTNEYALVGGTSSSLSIWNIATGELHPITPYYESFRNVYWDIARNEIIGVYGNYALIGFDLTTGAQIERYEHHGQIGPINFAVSDDNNLFVSFTDESRHWGSSRRSRTYTGLNIWERASQTHIELDAGEYAAYSPTQIAVSQDNRYLVIGIESLRVWDIQNLPENVGDRDPIYNHAGPEGFIQSVRFVDWGIIETVSADGVQRWDLHTGIYIPN